MLTVQKYFEFVYPLWLVALLVLPFVAVFDYRKRNLVKFPVSSITIYDTVKSKPIRVYFEWLPSFIKFIACVLIVIALARPREVNQITQTQSQGYDIILVLDASDSMQAVDMELDGKELEFNYENAFAVYTEFPVIGTQVIAQIYNLVEMVGNVEIGES